MKLKCLIVDDEPPAHKIMQNYIQKLDYLESSGNCYNALETLQFLESNPIDILFLDIEMPDLNGLEMLKTGVKMPSVILTTAYQQFALESFEWGVSDYLLKPIRFERFLKAVLKIKEAKESKEEKENYLFIKSDGIFHRIDLAEILYIEAMGNFVKIFYRDHFLLTAETMHEMQARLPENTFPRVHKSHIVNKSKIDRIEGNQIMIRKQIIPIGVSYRSHLLQLLGLKGK